VLRFSENFRTNDGQDLTVNLRGDNGELSKIGDLQSTAGEQYYELADDIDLSEWDEVLIVDEGSDNFLGSAFLTPAT